MPQFYTAFQSEGGQHNIYVPLWDKISSAFYKSCFTETTKNIGALFGVA